MRTTLVESSARMFDLLEQAMRPRLCLTEGCLSTVEPLTEVEIAAPVARVDYCRRCWQEEER